MPSAKGEVDLTEEKFVSDFVIFVNIDKKAGTSHQHDGTLRFDHVAFYAVSREAANKIYKTAVQRDYAIPLWARGTRKLANIAVTVPGNEMSQYLEAWYLMR